MFRLNRFAVFVLIVSFVCAVWAEMAQAQCNTGQNNNQLQAQVTANQALALQQAAAIAAQQQTQQTTITARSRQVSNFQVAQPLALATAQPTCTTCQQQPSAIAQARPAAPLPSAPPTMMLVRMTPPSNPQKPPENVRYVLMSGESRGLPIQLAAR